MVKFTGRLSFVQDLPSKPTKWSIKVFVLSDAHNGYVYDWKVYTGAERGNTAHNAIADLTAELNNRGHILYYDSFFSYIETVKDLSRRGFGSCGALNKTRRLLPVEIKKAEKNMPEE